MNVTTYAPDELVEFRKHSVYRFTDNIWKIVQFYDDRERHGPGPVENQKSYEEKLPASVSRAKRCILEYALCNHWDFFVTLTISTEYDRKDLKTWFKSFLQWLRDRRKQGSDIRYLLIPERHLDGSWHAHGLLSGVPESELETFRQMRRRGCKVPNKLVNSSYLNWKPYSEKYGYVSLGIIKNPISAAFYCTKYVIKDNTRIVNDVGLHTYYHSRPLLRPDKLTEFYTRSPEIDSLLTGKYEFCATGFAFPSHGCDFATWLALDGVVPDAIDFGYLDLFEDLSQFADAEDFYNYDQLIISNFGGYYDR